MSATATDSRYKGYLAPTSSSLSVSDLEKKLQDFISGVTGLDGCLVRAAYKNDRAEPPAAHVDWCAFQISEVLDNDFYLQDSAPIENGIDYKQVSTQKITVLTSFYGPDAWEKASILRDGCQLEQNRELFYRASRLKLISMGGLVAVGETYLNRWRDRVDLKLTFSRIRERHYEIKTIVDAQVRGHTEQRKDVIKVGYFNKEEN